MGKQPTKYVSKKPDAQGIYQYTDEENAIWQLLYARQQVITPQYACKEYIEGHRLLSLPKDRVPQLTEVSERLMKTTGWQVAPVPALISYAKFFGLLANKKFPAATFIRVREEIDYLQEPDIFHEIYGHCPMLTDPVYANFMEAYGKIGAAAPEQDQPMLARLYWFTVEFGLINTAEGVKAYGAGILSSPGETPYSIESHLAERRAFEIINALRTPYRIDIFQTVYFVINNYQQLYDLTKQNLLQCIEEAQRLGQFAPTFPPKPQATSAC